MFTYWNDLSSTVVFVLSSSKIWSQMLGTFQLSLNCMWERGGEVPLTWCQQGTCPRIFLKRHLWNVAEVLFKWPPPLLFTYSRHGVKQVFRRSFMWHFDHSLANLSNWNYLCGKSLILHFRSKLDRRSFPPLFRVINKFEAHISTTSVCFFSKKQ